MYVFIQSIIQERSEHVHLIMLEFEIRTERHDFIIVYPVHLSKYFGNDSYFRSAVLDLEYIHKW